MFWWCITQAFFDFLTQTKVFPPVRKLTSLLLRVSLSSLSESHQGPEVGSEYRPAEHGRRVNAHQPADESALAALQ